MIKPSIGRVVWYRSPVNTAQAMAAIVTWVHDDRKVNLAVFNHNGDSSPKTDVLLLQEGDSPPAPFVNASGQEIPRAYCEWMPFQQGQAKIDFSKMAWLDSHEERLATLEATLTKIHGDLSASRQAAKEPGNVQVPTAGAAKPAK